MKNGEKSPDDMFFPLQSATRKFSHRAFIDYFVKIILFVSTKFTERN